MARTHEEHLEYCRSYQKTHRVQIATRKKAWFQANKKTHSESTRRWARANKLAVNRNQLSRYYSNRDVFLKRAKEYFEGNRLKIYARRKQRLATNIQCKLSLALRQRLNKAVSNGYKSGSAVKELGCSIEFLKTYLSDRFKTGMNWSNWGRTRGCWHIDHIRPLSSFDLSDIKQLRIACNFTNLQPLWGFENISKGGHKCG